MLGRCCSLVRSQAGPETLGVPAASVSSLLNDYLLLVGGEVPRLDAVVAAARVDSGAVGVPGAAQHRLLVRVRRLGHAAPVGLDLPAPHLQYMQ